jgi:DNA-binding transcriptional LysR family regulator
MDRLLSMRVFERVVDDGGFAAAARALDMSPAVVTRLLADLEDHLGVRLLQRTTRRLSLTEAGKTYLGRVRSILQDIDEAHAVTSSQTNELTGVLRLHAPPVLASYVLGPLLLGFRQKYPQIRIDIEVDSLSDPMIEDYDVTLLAADASFDANVIARKVIESDVILVASPDYVKRRGMPQTPTDLVGHDCLRLKMTGGPSQVWRMWREPHPEQSVDLAGQPVVSANHTDTLLRAALDGAGIMSISVDLVAPYLTRGELVRVLHPWIAGRLAVYAAMPSRKFIPQRTRVFLDYLTEETRRQMTAAMEACTACKP